jgi:hypothetical protein
MNNNAECVAGKQRQLVRRFDLSRELEDALLDAADRELAEWITAYEANGTRDFWDDHTLAVVATVSRRLKLVIHLTCVNCAGHGAKWGVPC